MRLFLFCLSFIVWSSVQAQEDLSSRFNFYSYTHDNLFGFVSWMDRIENMTPTSSDQQLEFLQEEDRGFWHRTDYGASLGLSKRAGRGLDLSIPIYSPYGENWQGISFGLEIEGGLTSWMWKSDPSDKRHALNPFKVEEIINWNEGERSQYMAKGSVFVSANATYYLFSAGVSLFLSGQFVVSLERLPGEKVLLSIYKAKTLGGAIVGSVGPASLSVARAKELGREFFFVLDLNNSLEMEALSKALWGNLKALEDIGVNPKRDLAHRNQWQGINFEICTPFLPLFYITQSVGKLIQEDEEVEEEFAQEEPRRQAYLRQYVEALYPRYRARSKLFVQEEDASKLVFFYEDSSATPERLHKQLEHLRGKISLDDFLSLDIPEEKRSLKYAKMAFDLNFNAELYGHLLQVWREKSRTASKASLGRQWKRLGKWLEEKNSQRFVKLGRLLWSSSRFFKDFWQEAKKCGASLELSIGGEKVRRLERHRVYPLTDACRL